MANPIEPPKNLAAIWTVCYNESLQAVPVRYYRLPSYELTPPRAYLTRGEVGEMRVVHTRTDVCL